MSRALHPEDARELLSEWRANSEKCQDLHRELPGIIGKCVEAGLTKKEIATRLGISRTTIHRLSKQSPITT